ncbi:hypothetical protein ACFSYD_09715 [Paracoccus aerius]
MKPGALSAVLLLAAVPAAALSAQSCPGPDLSQPPDGATSVEVRHADVPNARFPGSGSRDAWGSVLSPVSRRLRHDRPGPAYGGVADRDVLQPQDRTCTYWDFGEVPEGMQPRARQLGRCLLGPGPEAAASPCAGQGRPTGGGTQGRGRRAEARGSARPRRPRLQRQSQAP